MGLEQVRGNTSAASPVDYDRYRLRRFVEALDAAELERRAGMSKLSAVAGALEANPKAVLFEQAGRRRACPRRQCAGEPHAVCAGLRRHAADVAAGNPAPFADQAGIRRGRPRRGAGAGSRHDRRRYRSHQAAGASAARQGWRTLYLRRHGFRARSGHRLHQRRPAPLHGARPRHHRHRPGRAERPAQHLSGDARARRAAADERRGRWPPGRLFRRHHAHAGRRDGAVGVAARGADAAGEEHHQRSARSRRRRMGARRLSRRGRLQGAGRALRRIPRLLRRRQDQSGVPRHRHHAPTRRAVPDAHASAAPP